MLDINYLRKNFDEVAKKLKTRYKTYPELDKFKEIDEQWRKLVAKIQNLNTERNNLSDEIASLVKQKKNDEITKIKSKVTNIKEQITTYQKELNSYEEQLNVILHSIPNVPHDSVPIGRDEKNNKEIRKWGEPNKSLSKLSSHWELAEKKGLVESAKATQLSGSRFVIYKNNGAKLIRALQWLTLDMNIKAGFQELLPPVILNENILIGTGHLPKFAEDLFKLTTNQYLSPTAEVQLTGYYANEILSQDSLPIWLTANTSCFRSEAGSAGKDTKGVIRLHQFYKTEMVMITNPNDSYSSLEKMVNFAESILQVLQLPYRVILLCTGDQGFAAAKTYDIEVWMPSSNNYREISSCSNCEDFQSRNLLLRVKDENKNIYPHTLNGSGLAIDRLWAAIIENYQEADGNVKLPNVLQKYFDNNKI